MPIDKQTYGQYTLFKQKEALVMQLTQKINTLGCIFFVLTALCLPLSIAGYNLTIALIVLCVLLSGNWQEKWSLIKSQRSLWLLLALLILFAIAMLYSSAEWSRRLYILKSYYKLLYIPFIVMLNPSRKWCNTALGAFVLANLVVALVAIAQVAAHLSYYTDPTGVFHNHIGGSMMLAMAAFICFIYGASSLKYKWPLLSLSLLFIATLFFFNVGKTGPLILLLGFIYIVFRKKDWKYTLSIMTLILIAFFIIVKFDIGLGKNLNLAISNSSSLLKNERNNATSTGMRSQFFRNSAHLIKQKPLVGYGTGSFKNEYFKAFGYPAWGPVKAGQPNNSYFVITIQLGLVGLTLYLLFLLSLWRDSLNSDKKTSANEIMLVGFAICCLTESFIRLSVGGFFFVFLISLILITKNHTKKA